MRLHGINIQAGDAIFTYQNSWLNRHILWFSKWRFPNSREVKIAHVAMYLGRIAGQPMIAEADWNGIVIRPINKYSSPKYKIHVARVKDYKILTKERTALVKYAKAKEGDSYAYMQIAALAIKKLFGLNRVGDWDKDSMICSEFYFSAFADCFRWIVVPGKRAHEITPLDLYDSPGMVKLGAE